MKKKSLVFLCILILFSNIFCSCSGIYNKKNNPAPKNLQESKNSSNQIYIGDININDKSKEQTLKLLKEKYQTSIQNKKIIVSVDNKNYELTFKDLKASYNIDKVVNDAYKALSKKNKSKDQSKENKFTPSLSYDKKTLDSFVNKIYNAVYKKPANAVISMTNSSNFKIKPEIIGETVDKENLKKDVTSAINNLYKSSENITIKVSTKKSNPKITKAQLQNINTKISTFSTALSGSSERINNITLGAKLINGTLLFPGETFSFNDSIGTVSKNTGFKEAPAIIENEMKPSVGGGLCQVATTLYNAVLRANIPYTERTKHTIPPKYVKPGLDATVFGNELDFKFKNTLKYPIYIQGYTKDGNIIFNIYSNSQLTKYKYDYTSEVYSTIPNATKYVKDSKLPKGKQVIDKPGSKGLKVKVYKITYKNGKQISKTLYYEDFYKPTDRIINIGQ